MLSLVLLPTEMHLLGDESGQVRAEINPLLSDVLGAKARSKKEAWESGWRALIQRTEYGQHSASA